MRKLGVWGALVLALSLGLLGAAGASAAKLDSVTLKAKPSGKKTRIAAVSNGKREIYITISTKKGGKWKVRDRDKAKGVKAGDGKVSISATQEGDSGSKNGGEGLLTVGEAFSNYFSWNAKQGRVYFYE